MTYENHIQINSACKKYKKSNVRTLYRTIKKVSSTSPITGIFSNEFTSWVYTISESETTIEKIEKRNAIWSMYVL